MKRLLTASVLGIAGTVGSVLLSSIETPALATLLLAGGVNSLVGVLGGVIANDGSVVWDKIGEKLQDNDTILQNNDLKKAVGIAIAAIIAQTAKDENKVNLAYKSYIKKLGKYTVDNWVKLCDQGIIALNEASLTPIQEHNLSCLMLQTSDDVKSLRIFNTDKIKDKEVWKNLVEVIIENSQILSDLKTIEEEQIGINNIIDNLAEALSNNFLKAFREVLKEDFANGGKAFAGFTIDMFKELQRGINESQSLILKKLDNLSINNSGEDSQLLIKLAELYTCTVENKEEIKNKLNDEFSNINQQLTALQSNNTEDKQTQSMIAANLGTIYGILGDYQQVIFYTDQSLQISREIGDKQGEITCLGNLGYTYELMGNPEEALHYYQLSLDIAEQINSRRQKATSLGYIANYHRNLGQYEKAIELQKDSLKIYESIKDNQGEAIALHDLANIYQCLNDFIKSIECYEKSLELSQNIGDQRGIADALGSIGSAYFSLKEYSQSIDYNEQSLNLNRTINHKRGEAISLGNLGNIYTDLADYSKAIEYYKESLMLNQEIGHKGGISINLGNLGNVERGLGNFQEAISYCQQSLAIKEETGDKQGIAISLKVIGQCYHSLEQYDNAISYYNKSLEIANEIGNISMVASAHFLLGETYTKLNKNKEAIQSYHYARELYQRMGLDSDIQDCDNAINTLSSPQRLSIWQRIKQILQRFLQWLRSLFHG